MESLLKGALWIGLALIGKYVFGQTDQEAYMVAGFIVVISDVAKIRQQLEQHIIKWEAQ